MGGGGSSDQTGLAWIGDKGGGGGCGDQICLVRIGDGGGGEGIRLV